MAQLALAEGGVIEIVGKRSTPARAVYPYPEDEGLEIIRIDGLQRANAGAGSGAYVEIRTIASKPATRVVFAPAQPTRRPTGANHALKRGLVGRHLFPGDVVGTRGQTLVDKLPHTDRHYQRAPD